MKALERELEQLGYGLVAGVDEAGRGALAGPVVVSAVLMRPDCLVPGVEDSKRLGSEQREVLERVIRGAAISSATIHVSAADIDRSDILSATRWAMRRALAELDPVPGAAIFDAVALPDLRFPSASIVKADGLCYSVACASILAKCARDRFMAQELDPRFPHYGFGRHKGYGSEAHREALSRFGPSPEHRLRFRSVLPRRAA